MSYLYVGPLGDHQSERQHTATWVFGYYTPGFKGVCIHRRWPDGGTRFAFSLYCNWRMIGKVSAYLVFQTKTHWRRVINLWPFGYESKQLHIPAWYKDSVKSQ